MKRLIYQVNVGKGSRLYDWCIGSVADYCKHHDIDHKIQTEPILRITPDVEKTGRSVEATARLGYLPIYEKENAFNYFPEYDQIAIIDSDIYIRENAPCIFDDLNEDTDFAGVIERDMKCTPQYRRKILAYSRGQYNSLMDVDWKINASGHEFYNMGLMVMQKSILNHLNGETPEQFIRRPEFKKFVDGIGKWKWSTDQTLLNYWVRKSGMKQQHLQWKWNGLFRGIDDRVLPKCHFIHFFLKDKLPNRGEDVDELEKVIRNQRHSIDVYHT
jgi:hypothetical protein